MRSYTTLSLIIGAGLLESTSAFAPSSSLQQRRIVTPSTPTLSRSASASALSVSTVSHLGNSAASAEDSGHDPSLSANSNNSGNNKKSYQNMPPATHAPVVEINSPEELAAFLNQDDRITVIKFHAAWCKSCQRFGHKYQGLANAKTDWISDDSAKVVREGSVRFGSIEYGANMALCKKLGIKKLPTVHLYQKGKGQLEAFPCGPKKFGLLVERLEHHLSTNNNSVDTGTGANAKPQIQQQEEQKSSDSEILSALKRAQEILAESRNNRNYNEHDSDHRVQVDQEANANHESLEAEMAAIFDELMEEEGHNQSDGSSEKSKKKWWKSILP